MNYTMESFIAMIIENVAQNYTDIRTHRPAATRTGYVTERGKRGTTNIAENNWILGWMVGWLVGVVILISGVWN